MLAAFAAYEQHTPETEELGQPVSIEYATICIQYRLPETEPRRLLKLETRNQAGEFGSAIVRLSGSL